MMAVVMTTIDIIIVIHMLNTLRAKSQNRSRKNSDRLKSMWKKNWKKSSTVLATGDFKGNVHAKKPPLTQWRFFVL